MLDTKDDDEVDEEGSDGEAEVAERGEKRGVESTSGGGERAGKKKHRGNGRARGDKGRYGGGEAEKGATGKK